MGGTQCGLPEGSPYDIGSPVTLSGTMDVDASRRHARAVLARALLGVVAVGAALGVLTATALAATTTPDPSPTGPSPIPAPTTVEPPAESPFDGIAGGDELGRVGEPLVAPLSAPLPAVDGFAWVVADADSGDVLAAFSPHERRPPASTIKLLTALTTFPLLDPDDTYVADSGPESVEGSRAGIVAEETYTVDDLMHGLILPSGNDAAYALGELAGGQDTAISLMNETARSLGAFDTDARSPHGLDTPGQLSSAYDLALIGRAALNDDTIATIARTPAYEFPGRDGDNFQIQNQNRLLDSYDGALGLKTGYTTQADHTFVGAAERNDRRLIVTILAADGRAEDSAAVLLDWAFGVIAAGEVEPVGHLVTPDEVEAAVAGEGEGDEDTDQGADGSDGSGGDAGGDGGGGGVADVTDRANRPILIWTVVAAVAIGGLTMLIVKRRRRPAGRYASGRR